MTEELGRPTLSGLIWEGDRAPLAKAFIAAQRAMDAIKKASTNAHFNNSYADLAAVVEAVTPALNNAGVGVLQAPEFDGQVVSVSTTLLHEGGSSVSSVLQLRPTKADPQGVGSAITYARRYSLLAMAGAAPEDDDGNEASAPGPAPRQHQPRPEPKRAEPQKPTLAERADRLAATLRGVKTGADLKRAYDLGSGLLADLDTADPERLAEINALYEARQTELTPKVAA